jgi:plastocyanin
MVSALLAGVAAAQESATSDDAVVIEFKTDRPAGVYYFEPAGVRVRPGQLVRFKSTDYRQSVTAYHPANDARPLRIPENAEPFDVMLGENTANYHGVFETRFTVEGTYDYFNRQHEARGAVGRIIVGNPGGPGERPMGMGDAPAQPEGFVGLSTDPTRLRSVRRIFDMLPSNRIMRDGKISLPLDEIAPGRAHHDRNVPIP